MVCNAVHGTKGDALRWGPVRLLCSKRSGLQDEGLYAAADLKSNCLQPVRFGPCLQAGQL